MAKKKTSKKSGSKKKTTPKKKPVAVVPEVIDPVKAVGRKCGFDQAKADKILVGLASGETLAGMCRKKGFPCRQTVTGWLLRGVSNESRELLEFAVKYKLAGDIRALLQEDTFLQTVKDIQKMSLPKLMAGEYIRQELVLNSMKWYLSKFRSRRTEVDGLEDAVRKLASAVGGEGDEEGGSGGGSGFRFVVHKQGEGDA